MLKRTSGHFFTFAHVCDCTLKDSVAWLDHINGKKHNRALGYAVFAGAIFLLPSIFTFCLQLQHEG
jgi:hypothetical protein